MSIPKGLAVTVEEELKKHQEIEKEVQTLAEQRNHLYQLANENGMVKQELDLLDQGETVYKMNGPVLMKEDLTDAQHNVAKRLEFIEGEMNKLNGLIGEKQKAQKVLADEIVKAQQEMQRKAAEEAHQVAAEALLGVQ
eukprot:217627_1